MMQIVVPMAGHGSRFAKAGYALPKPLIEVHGQPMIAGVVRNIRPAQPHRFIFLCLQEHLQRYNLQARLEEIAPGCAVVPVAQVTQGAACTVLLARELINNSQPLMIANSDQYVEVDINQYLAAMDGYDGIIMTMSASDPKWSFVKLDQDGVVLELREKEVISSEATVGIYNYRRGADFVYYAEQMIAKNIRVNHEFYVAPVYNEMIAAGKRITCYNVGKENQGMYGLGIPEDLERFLKNPLSHKAYA